MKLSFPHRKFHPPKVGISFATKRFRQSVFTLPVCLAIVFSLVLGLFGGFFLAGLAFGENYGSVYQSLLFELEQSRQCLERERQELKSLRDAHKASFTHLWAPSADMSVNALNNHIKTSETPLDFRQACLKFINRYCMGYCQNKYYTIIRGGRF